MKKEVTEGGKLFMEPCQRKALARLFSCPKPREKKFFENIFDTQNAENILVRPGFKTG